MKEYIDREAVLAYPIRKNNYDHEHGNEHFIFGIESVIEFVENLPAADVAPVRHGRWIEEHGETFIPIEYDTNGEPILHNYVGYHCSLCGRYEPVQEPYCNCGALMDGKEDDHD